MHRLSKAQARRIAVRAQLLDANRPTDLLEVVQQLTLLQIDPTAAIAPNADLVAWSRLGSSTSSRARQPLLWLFIFGTALQDNQTLSGGYPDYRAFLVPGVMAQAALFVAIFFGLGVIWERDVGQLQRLLATATPRLGIVLGRRPAPGFAHSPRASCCSWSSGSRESRSSGNP